MNNWICPKCNAANAERFCLNCGEERNLETQSPPDLPPTVFGVPPVSPTNQPNQFQNQPDFVPPNTGQTPNQPPVSAAPRKSGFLKILLIVGIIGLLVVSAAGFLLYIKVIEPRLSQQKWDKQDREALQKANLLTAKELLPESITTKSQLVPRAQMFDKFQLFEATKNKMPEVNADIKDINDAASARYASADKREAGLLIFKYNTPEQAKNVCQKMGQEMIKNEKNFVNKPMFGYDERTGFCGIWGDLKNGESVSVDSLYGFLYIISGYKDYRSELHSAVWSKLR